VKSIAVIAEDLAFPLDEGFKKASASLVASIADLGVKVSLFCHKADIPHFAAQPLPANKLLIGQAFARALKRTDADAVLYIPEAAATPMSLVRARLLRRQSGGKPVAVLSLQSRALSRPLAPLVRLLAPSLLMVLSRRSRDAARAWGSVAETVPLGVDTVAFRPADPIEAPALRKKYGIPEGKVLLHVGHISPRRNLGLLRRILCPGRYLVVVSSTSTRHHPEVRRSLEGSPVIFLDTYIERIEEIYRTADCYVFPTMSDRGAIEIPLSVLEAMATNLPVVTTAFGGLPDLFPGNEVEQRGLFIAGSADVFAEKIEQALALGVASTRRLALDLSWNKVAERMLSTIEATVQAETRLRGKS
jgi:glycosyltransferase involved in cell wall biosynthesis